MYEMKGPCRGGGGSGEVRGWMCAALPHPVSGFSPLYNPFGPLTAPLAPFFCMFDLGSISPRFTTFYHLGSSAGGVMKWASRVYNQGIPEPSAAYSWASPGDFSGCVRRTISGCSLDIPLVFERSGRTVRP
jgi:hypothetical protein